MWMLFLPHLNHIDLFVVFGTFISNPHNALFRYTHNSRTAKYSVIYFSADERHQMTSIFEASEEHCRSSSKLFILDSDCLPYARGWWHRGGILIRTLSVIGIYNRLAKDVSTLILLLTRWRIVCVSHLSDHNTNNCCKPHSVINLLWQAHTDHYSPRSIGRVFRENYPLCVYKPLSGPVFRAPMIEFFGWLGRRPCLLPVCNHHESPQRSDMYPASMWSHTIPPLRERGIAFSRERLTWECLDRDCGFVIENEQSSDARSAEIYEKKFLFRFVIFPIDVFFFLWFFFLWSISAPTAQTTPALRFFWRLVLDASCWEVEGRWLTLVYRRLIRCQKPTLWVWWRLKCRE